jgi:Fusaric acid resistance protein-like
VLQTQLHQTWLTVKSLPWDKAVRYTLSIGIPLVVGAATGFLRYGVVALIGSMYVVNIANADSRPKDRLFITLAGSVLITGCAQLGSFVTHFPILIALGVLVLGTAAGWLHRSHMAIEIMVRFAVLGFLFGALQLAAFGTQLIPINENVIFVFLSGGLWTAIVLGIEHWLLGSNRLSDAPALREGWQRIRSGQTAGLQFALCYGIVAMIAFEGSVLLHLPRPFWVAATTLVVMKPDSRATVQRTSQRIMGTLLGVLLVEGIITATHDPNILITFILLVSPLIPIGLAKSYTLCCAAITVLVMVMIDLLTLSQGGDQSLLPVRFYATLIGSILTVVGTAIAYPELWLHKGGRDH